MSRYDIYMHNRPQEDTTPLSAQSPDVTTSNTSSPTINLKSGALILYGGMAAKTTYRTLTNEIKADGNERLAMQMNNAANLVTKGIMLYATGGWAAIPMGIEATATAISERKETIRQNKVTSIENKLRGQRRNFVKGGLYSD